MGKNVSFFYSEVKMRTVFDIPFFRSSYQRESFIFFFDSAHELITSIAPKEKKPMKIANSCFNPMTISTDKDFGNDSKKTKNRF